MDQCLVVTCPMGKTPPLVGLWVFRHPPLSESKNEWVTPSSQPKRSNCKFARYSPFKYLAILTAFSVSLSRGAAIGRDAS